MPVGESILVVYQNLSKATRLHEFRLLRGERERQKEKKRVADEGIVTSQENPCGRNREREREGKKTGKR